VRGKVSTSPNLAKQPLRGKKKNRFLEEGLNGNILKDREMKSWGVKRRRREVREGTGDAAGGKTHGGQESAGGFYLN